MQGTLHGGVRSVSIVAAGKFCCARRWFVQGGPPPPKLRDGIEPMKKLHSHREEMDARYAAERAAEREFYARTPHIPAPLPHNSHEKGKYGMRRRLKVHQPEDDIDVESLGAAVETGNHAMRKG
ncbi:uncharacterized protein Tco025E_06959 [Trypanosoma conorhini]|uniref:Uncharacterized protein n=1 Tax=Trypanosoma conorhini TaxID=83891 RepID=A0A422NVN1_9TRYP|nr:uncharacterized protein Tco025E_06959 [Trypanosoma conorhini]RNF09533.1 hypothetical protein Tco025E_06959 [Trypanosoma conorhini]